MVEVHEILREVDGRKNDIVDFVRELIRTPSPTGKEQDVANIIIQKLKTTGFSHMLDPVGNVVGVLKGQGTGKSLLLNGHMDHVPPGDMVDPYSGKIVSGKAFGIDGQVIYGRGASDMKGALGAMIMAGSILNELKIPLAGDLIVAGTVFEEELGNIGPPALIDLDHLRPDAALIGECTNLNLAYGNRGVVRIKLTTRGKSCHVSVQDRGVNALYKMMNVIDRIIETNKALPSHPILGKSSWAICRINVQPNIVNVIPDKCEVEIDVRNVPNFSLDQIIDELTKVVTEISSKDPDFQADISLNEFEVKTWTGYKIQVQPIALPFYIDPNHWLVQEGLKSIAQVICQQAKLNIWGFTTECYCFSERGIPTIGFGPGEERFTHSNNEVVSINDLLTATKVYAVLTANICNT